MIVSFKDIKDGDFIYSSECLRDGQEDNPKFFKDCERLFKKYTPLIGKFIVKDVKHIISEVQDISDMWSEPEYKEVQCDKISFKIDPVDDNAKKYIETNWSHNDGNKSIILDFTRRTKPLDHTCGNGTLLNLFLTKELAVMDATLTMQQLTLSDEDLNKIIDVQQHNKEQMIRISNLETNEINW